MNNKVSLKLSVDTSSPFVSLANFHHCSALIPPAIITNAKESFKRIYSGRTVALSTPMGGRGACPYPHQNWSYRSILTGR